MPTDRSGLTLSTSTDAAACYRTGIDRCCGSTRDPSSISRARSGRTRRSRSGTRRSRCWPPSTATGTHAKIHLHLAERNTVRASARERSAVHALGVVCTGDGPSAFQALVRHLTDYPSDALLLDVAFPTIAFSGVTETSAEVWSLVEGAAPAYGDDWFYLSLLAFVRQEQERYDEALALAERALEIEPFSGHAVHAAAHVHYET